MYEVKRHPLNAAGDFYVEYDMCMCCDAPVAEAPELMAYDENVHCYFKRQPENESELLQAINAVRVSCIEAVRYGGSDPAIIDAVGMPFGSRHLVPPADSPMTDKILAILRKLLGYK